MNMSPVFIHSLFRTGSTYIWLKFRNNKKNCCYYEPFNEVLSVLSKDVSCELNKTFAIDVLGHPQLGRRYFYEYEKLLIDDIQGVPCFQKSFVADEFCCVNNTNKLIKYVDFLISSSGHRRPVFQFCRSSLRVDWFVRNYPEACNIYIVRNPRDNWASYVINSQKGNNYFLVMNLVFAGLNKKNKYLNELAKRVLLIEYRNDDFGKEFKAYSQILDAYSLEEKYFIFYYIWFCSLVENVLRADFILNINKLNEDLDYRKKTIDFLLLTGVNHIDFSDVNIKKYSCYPLSNIKMDEIEREVLGLVLPIYNNNISVFLEMLPADDREYLGVGRLDTYIKAKSGGLFPVDQQNNIGKYKKIVELLLDKNVKLTEHLENREHQIRLIHSSLFWRLLTPVRWVKRLSMKMFAACFCLYKQFMS
jgi:hypothetical protein